MPRNPRAVEIVRFVGDEVTGSPALQIREIDRDERFVKYEVVYELVPSEQPVALAPEYSGQVALPVEEETPDGDLLADFVDTSRTDDPVAELAAEGFDVAVPAAPDDEFEAAIDEEMPDLPS